MVEQRPVKALVAGSSPAPGARFVIEVQKLEKTLDLQGSF